MHLTPGAPLARGQALRQQGRLAEAAAVFRELLAIEPRNAQALHLLGITLGQMGRPKEAVDLIRAATEVQPSNPVLHTNLGNALSESGRHAEAAKAYARALALRPDLGVAHRGRALALLRAGKAQEALASLEEALRLAPGEAQLHNDLGVVLERLGRKREALERFEQAVTLDPRHVEAYLNQSLIELSLGRCDRSLRSLDRALEVRPQHPALHAGRGNALRGLGRHAEALESYDRALALAPADVRVLHKRGLTLLSLGRLEEAVESFDRALGVTADDFASHFHRGVALSMLDRHAEALASFERASALNGAAAEALHNRGVELGHLARHEEALGAFAAAARCKPDYTDAYAHCANTLMALGRYAEALETLDRALAIEPDHAPSLWSKGLIKLTQGELEEGWTLYESRLRLQHLKPYHREFAAPRWSGAEPLAGKRILIHAEQGLGDTLQFCRYVPLLEREGAQVVFEVAPALRQLLRSLAMRGTLLTSGEPLPEVDCFSPLLSLPLAFRTRLETVPGGVPYVRAAPESVDRWRERLRELPGLKIGLNWQGHLGAERQTLIRGRSFALEAAAPLAQLADVTLVSLQKGPAAAQREQVEFGASLAQLTDPLDESAEALNETAALMSALDLIITSDTSVAHLAGSLGLPVWVALQAFPDWRWMLERLDSPWYPTMRLFRQRVRGDFREVFERVAGEVAELTGRRRRGEPPQSP